MFIIEPLRNKFKNDDSKTNKDMKWKDVFGEGEKVVQIGKPDKKKDGTGIDPNDYIKG